MFGEWLENVRAQLAELIGPYVQQAGKRLDPLIGQARGRYQKLEPREQLLIKIAAGLFGVFLLYNMVYRPIVGLSSGMDDRIATRRHDLIEVRRLAATYTQLKSDLRNAEHHTVPGHDFSLFSVIEASLTKSVGRDKIGSITPGSDRKVSEGLTEFNVQLKLANVNLAQLVDALYGISTLEMPIGVENVRIQRRSQDTHSYDVDMTCVALAKNA
jgi:type II secretory pathway component PulM